MCIPHCRSMRGNRSITARIITGPASEPITDSWHGQTTWGKFPYPYNTAGMKTVSEDFQGTLQSRINVAWIKDRIQYFPETEKKPVSVTYDFADTADSLYAPEYLETKNQYGFFLNDNHAFIEIHTGYNPGKTLFEIRIPMQNS